MRKDLFDWGRIMILITVGFGFAMHMLAPEYRLEGSPGACRSLGFGFRIGLGFRWQPLRVAPFPTLTRTLAP